MYYYVVSLNNDDGTVTSIAEADSAERALNTAAQWTAKERHTNGDETHYAYVFEPDDNTLYRLAPMLEAIPVADLPRGFRDMPWDF